jgi:undecaprenyl-diphosphatase
MSNPFPRPSAAERRERERTWRNRHLDLLYGGLRFAMLRARDINTALGAFLVAGALVTILALWGFVQVAELVREGATQSFDDGVMHWVAANQDPAVRRFMLEMTALGNWPVTSMVVAVAALFLWLTRHKYSSALLLVSTAGGVAINGTLKFIFSRPRPEIFEWGTYATSSSFPSGHATSATIAYATVAYLAARLHERRWARFLTMTLALLFIFLVSASRVYLGVHFPSDVLGGVISGLAWAALCMATLEAIQKLALRRAPQILKDEEPAPKDVGEGS